MTVKVCLRGHKVAGNDRYIAPTGAVMCQACRRIRQKQYAGLHPEKMAISRHRKRERDKNNPIRAAAIKARDRKWRHKNSDRVKAGARVARKAAHLRCKIQAFEHYGGPVCKCCGESNIKFLTLDHIDNDGKKHRKEVTGANIYAYLKSVGYPKLRLQVLCYQCNCGRNANGGICPHKETPNGSS